MPHDWERPWLFTRCYPWPAADCGNRNCGLAFGRAEAQQQVVTQLQQLVGAESAKAIQAILQAQKPSTGLIASLVGFVVLLAGASGVFTELRVALNRIWRVPPRRHKASWG